MVGVKGQMQGAVLIEGMSLSRENCCSKRNNAKIPFFLSKCAPCLLLMSAGSTDSKQINNEAETRALLGGARLQGGCAGSATSNSVRAC
jgi:hypothetical protein